MPPRPTFSELEDRITDLLNTSGGMIWNGWKAIDTAVAALQGNSKDLGAIEERINTNAHFQLSVSGNKNPDREALMLDLERRLLNFLASAVAVDDQLSAHAKRLHRHTLFPEIRKRRSDLLSRCPSITFVRALRNIALHLILPEVTMVTEIKAADGKTINQPGGTTYVSFNLNTDHCHALLRTDQKRGNSEETKLAFEYLDDNPEISLKELSAQYVSELIPHAMWQKKYEHDECDHELSEFVDKWNEIADIWNS